MTQDRIPDQGTVNDWLDQIKREKRKQAGVVPEPQPDPLHRSTPTTPATSTPTPTFDFSGTPAEPDRRFVTPIGDLRSVGPQEAVDLIRRGEFFDADNRQLFGLNVPPEGSQLDADTAMALHALGLLTDPQTGQPRFPITPEIRQAMGQQGVLGIPEGIQTIQRTGAGLLTEQAQKLIPGEQLVERRAREFREQSAGPLEAVRQSLEVEGESALPSTTVSLPFRVPLPGGRSLQDVQVGVQGFLENVVADPLNLLGGGKALTAARLGTRGLVRRLTERGASVVIPDAPPAPGRIRALVFDPDDAPEGRLMEFADQVEADRIIDELEADARNNVFVFGDEATPQEIEALRHDVINERQTADLTSERDELREQLTAAQFEGGGAIEALRNDPFQSILSRAFDAVMGPGMTQFSETLTPKQVLNLSNIIQQLPRFKGTNAQALAEVRRRYPMAMLPNGRVRSEYVLDDVISELGSRYDDIGGVQQFMREVESVADIRAKIREARKVEKSTQERLIEVEGQINQRLRTAYGVPSMPGSAATSPTLADIMGDLRSADVLVASEFTQDAFRRIAEKVDHIPGLRDIQRAINPAAAFRNPGEQAMTMRAMWFDEATQKATAIRATWERLGRMEDVFSPVDDTGAFTDGPLAGKFLNDIRSKPSDFLLSPEQRAYVDLLNRIDEAATDYLISNGIDIKKLALDEGGFFAGRRVVARVVDTADGPEVLEHGFIGSAPSRPGLRLSTEKHRIFKTQEDAVKEGFRYMSDEEALFIKVRGAYQRVADERMADWLFEQVPWRTTAGPENLRTAIQGAKAGVARTKRAIDLAEQQLKASRGQLSKVQGDVLEITLDELGFGNQVNTVTNVSTESRRIKSVLSGSFTKVERLRREAAAEGFRGQALEDRLTRLRERLQKYQERVDSLADGWKDALETAQRTHFEEARINAPAFQGKILTGKEAQEVADTITRTMTRQQNKALREVNKVQAVARMFGLGVDASLMFIQLVLLMGFKPVAFGKAGAGFVRGLVDPVFHARYLADNADVIRQSPGLLLARSGNEFTEAMQRGGLLSRVALIRKPVEPFARAVETALDVAGIEMKKALQHRVKTAADNAQLDAFVNELRGLVSTSRLGVSPVQRQLETAALLAPRYNRAVAALLADTARGGLRGKLARRALMRGTVAVMLTFAALSFLKGESPEEVGNHFIPIKNGKPNPNFMMLDIAGQRVGPGSKIISVLNLIAKSWANPGDLAKFTAEDWMDNPALRFVRGNLAPIPSTGLDILTGRDFMGDTTREGALDITKTLLLENLTPLWIQSVLFEGGSVQQRALRGAADFFGLRAYENSPFARFVEHVEKMERNLPDKRWQELYGDTPRSEMKWELMPPNRRKHYQLRDVQGSSLWRSFTHDLEERGRVNKYLARAEGFRVDGISKLQEAEAEVLAGRAPLRDFRAAYDSFGRDLGSKIEGLRKLPEFSKAIKELESRPPSEQPIAVAYRQYLEIVHDPELDGPFGYDSRTQRERLRELRARVGEDVWGQVMEARELDRFDLPRLAQELTRDREAIAPYWQIRDRMLDRRGVRDKWDRYQKLPLREQRDFLRMRANDDLALALREIDAEQERFRRANPEIERLLLKWEYLTSPLAPENIRFRREPVPLGR